MLSMKTKQEIILRYFREGHSQRKISETLSVGRRTVKKYIVEYEAAQKGLSEAGTTEKTLLMAQVLEKPRYNTGVRARQKLTTRMISRIDECLAKNCEKRQSGKHKQVMKKVDIWELPKKEGQAIGYTTVCNYVRSQEHRQETYIRQHYEPGQVCEFDWGEVKLELNGPWHFFKKEQLHPHTGIPGTGLLSNPKRLSGSRHFVKRRSTGVSKNCPPAPRPVLGT